jgi:hypothetical protein
MEKFLTVTHNDEAGAINLKEYRMDRHSQKMPCIIVTEHPDFANISCDNWLSTDDSLITVEGRMMIEDQLQQLQRKYPETKIEFSTSEVKASNISNPLPLWYNFTNVPLAQAKELAEIIYDIYLKALPHGKRHGYHI